MNRKQAQEWQGKDVLWRSWPFTYNEVSLSDGEIIHWKESVNTIWILQKLTKGGLCMISRHGSKGSISIPPFYLDQWENP